MPLVPVDAAVDPDGQWQIPSDALQAVPLQSEEEVHGCCESQNPAVAEHVPVPSSQHPLAH